MKKELTIAVISFFALVITSTLALNYWHAKKIERPEGYSKPEIEVTEPKRPARVMDLDIAENANKYFAKTMKGAYEGRVVLHMNAWAPGAGWLRWKTRDGLTPIIEFKKVTQQDINRFNQFSKSINMPIRLALSGKVLKIWAEETEADLAQFRQADGTIKQAKAPQGFYKLKAPPEVYVKKDKSGKAFIVQKKDKDKEQPAEAVALKEENKE